MNDERNALIESEPNPFDWPEDFNHENGQYLNQCGLCKTEFTGHKRRVVCKACDRHDREMADCYCDPDNIAVCQKHLKERIESETESLRKKLEQIKHCDRCGGSWVDDGINYGCPCIDLQSLRKEVADLKSEVARYERMMAKLDTADFDGDFCINKFHPIHSSRNPVEWNGRYYDEDGSVISTIEPQTTPLRAFEALTTASQDETGQEERL